MVIARSARLANQYLHLIESESKYLDLNLNQNKCSYLAFNGNGTLRFANGQPMICSEEVLYLGVKVTEKIDPKHEIRSRISATMAILERLNLFWLKTKCYKKWKLLVHDAVITSKLFYGLETLEPTIAAANLLNVFQLEGLRKTLNLHTTFVQRRNTNEYVY